MLKLLCIAGINCSHLGKQHRAPVNRLRPVATVHPYSGCYNKERLAFELTVLNDIVYGVIGHYRIIGTPLTNEISKSYINGKTIKECIADLNESIDCFRKAEELKQRLGVI